MNNGVLRAHREWTTPNTVGLPEHVSDVPLWWLYTNLMSKKHYRLMYQPIIAPFFFAAPEECLISSVQRHRVRGRLSSVLGMVDSEALTSPVATSGPLYLQSLPASERLWERCQFIPVYWILQYSEWLHLIRRSRGAPIRLQIACIRGFYSLKSGRAPCLKTFRS